ncbi:ac76 [Erannis ankeraria nucleopolyhedrovirus]|uniref:ac76 n=1 Tax=Erannis ankeraria nucleopolyhedrovirus TaxID=2913600 RepID=UPI002481DEFE|nr:ac76 [Erannis ankeraria nucleopolyhedrovirus]UJZ89026.1 ac76 [Erannis ankeraria nucleopolyhedrovirus]
MFIYTTFLVLILLGFIFDKNEGFSNFLMVLLLTFIIFILMLQVYYIKPESTTTDLQTNNKTKSIKKKRDLEKAFDAILNKNTSSTD